MNCLECPKAVTNSIVHASHPRGFHKPAQKCEENIIIFCLKVKFLSIVRNMPVLHCGPANLFFRQSVRSWSCLLWKTLNVYAIALINLNSFVRSVIII